MLPSRRSSSRSDPRSCRPPFPGHPGGAGSGAGRNPIPAGCAPRCWRCSWAPPWPTCGVSASMAWAPTAMPRPSRPGPSVGARAPSASPSFISVDTPPASLWIMELSGRLFGFGTWSMLVPQALEGVAAVGLLYAAVRRWYGGAAGLLAGVALALTPVAALMFRFNNPDALLVLLLVAAAYATTRAIERASGAWLGLAGVFIGFGFLTKMLQ